MKNRLTKSAAVVCLLFVTFSTGCPFLGGITGSTGSIKHDKWKVPGYYKGANITTKAPNPIGPQHFLDLKSAGANLVQLSVSGTLTVDTHQSDTAARTVLSNYVNWARAAGLDYTIAVRSGPGRWDVDDEKKTPVTSTIWVRDNEQASYGEMLKEIARDFGGDERCVGLAPMVEPDPVVFLCQYVPGCCQNGSSLCSDYKDANGKDSPEILRQKLAYWEISLKDMYQGWISQIRSVQPDLPILIQGPSWANPYYYDLLADEPIDDPYIVFEVHNYEPTAFSQEGADTFSVNLSEVFASVDRLNSATSGGPRPVFVGEFGKNFTFGDSPCTAADYFKQQVDYFRGRGWHFAYWNWGGYEFDVSAADPQVLDYVKASLRGETPTSSDCGGSAPGDGAFAWQSLGGGLNGLVVALAEYNSELYAGGDMSGFISKWNGSSWQSVGTGMSYSVDSLAVYGSELIAGGRFTMAGGTGANRIARWNGTNWQPLGSGMDSDVIALTMYNGELIAGGKFTTADGVSAKGIARWNGMWQPLGSGINGIVGALAVYNGELIAGGFFTTAGGASAKNIARWNGTNWQPLGSGMDSDVIALTLYDGELIAGGFFTTAGGASTNHIARWNGTNWQPLGSGLDPPNLLSHVRAITVYNGELIAGGFIITANGASAKHIARWNGTNWQTLGSEMNDIVHELAVYNGELIAGGQFGTAGGVDTNHIAKWVPAP